MLKDVLTKDVIQLHVEARDWEDAIRQASLPLLQLYRITADYVDAMIQAVHVFGPYIVMAPGIALAHAEPGARVMETCLSMTTLKEPVCFGSVQNDPVSILFVFGAKNLGDHLTLLQDLAHLLSDENAIERIKTGTDGGSGTIEAVLRGAEEN